MQPDPFGGQTPLADPLDQKRKKTDQIGLSAVSAYNPLFGTLGEFGSSTSKKIGGDNTNYWKGGLGQIADPGNPFRGSGKETGKGTMAGNFFKNIILGKNAWDAITGRNVAFAKKYKVQQATAQVSARNKAFGPAASAGLNQMFAGDQTGAPQFAGGGAMAGKPAVISGGHFKTVGESVEVKGNKPSVKDGVDTTVAKLDDGEMIDSRNRVYSDRIRHHDGRSMAEHAKGIEHRRSVNPGADQDLDDLFAYQEAQKPTGMKSNSNPPPSVAYQKSQTLTVNPAGAKQHLAGGGSLDPGKRLILKTGSSAASARPSVNGQTITTNELRRIQGQSNSVKIPFRVREKIVPVKDKVNPLRKPAMAQGGVLTDEEQTIAAGVKGAMAGGSITLTTVPKKKTRMGLTIQPKSPGYEVGNDRKGRSSTIHRPVKMANFTRSGFR